MESKRRKERLGVAGGGEVVEMLAVLARRLDNGRRSNVVCCPSNFGDLQTV